MVCYKVGTLPRGEHVCHKAGVHTFALFASLHESHLHALGTVCERTGEPRDRQGHTERIHYKLSLVFLKPGVSSSCCLMDVPGICHR
jgi:hypothetical protein